jgi:hypothetical protein
MSDEKSKNPSREEIELRAYQIYVERGCEDGHDLEDWLAAEELLTAAAESEILAPPMDDSPRTVVEASRPAKAA